MNGTVLPGATLGFTLTAMGAAIGGIMSGLFLIWWQHRLEEKRTKHRYESIRSELITELLNNFRKVGEIFRSAVKNPYNKIDKPMEISGLASNRIIITGGKVHVLHLEAWNLATPHLVSMAANIDDVKRLTRAFQVFKDCQTSPNELPDAYQTMAKVGAVEPGMVIEPNIITKDGLHQIVGIPANIFRIRRRIRDAVVPLIREFGKFGEAEEAETIAKLLTDSTKGWVGLVEENVYIRMEFLPRCE